MNGDITIRGVSEGDFAGLCELYCRSVRCNPEGFIQDLDFHGCLRAKTGQWRDLGGDMFVGYAGQEVIAIGGLAPESDTHVELCKLHVDPSYQGRGIGRMLTEHMISVARHKGFSQVVLHVTATQKAAINLYKSLGFQPQKRKVFSTSVYNRTVSFDTLYMYLPLSA
ncbi:MAG: GNAT family N-acetyltransferase [Hyphomicrobiales bacterium]|nr:GNAT family N-acetyltransferase [Hyphomicrobiales bacterium]